MKDFFKNIQTLLIVVLITLLFFQRSCSSTPTPDPEVITKIEVRYDTIETVKEVYVPKWRTKIETKYDTTFVDVPAHVDTLNILKDYYSKYEYTDTLYLDSLGYVILTDTISQNTILKRSQVPSIVIPTKIVNNTIFINNREFYTGFGVRTNGKNISWMGLEGVLKNKKGNTFVLGIGTDNENKFSLGGSVHWKIGNE